MHDPIRWQVAGSPHIHSIPSKALVEVKGSRGSVKVWIDDKGSVCIQTMGCYKNCVHSDEQREFEYWVPLKPGEKVP